MPTVTSPDLAPPSASALRIVVAAERLLALHGIDGVSMRQIATEAGSANNSRSASPASVLTPA